MVLKGVYGLEEIIPKLIFKLSENMFLNSKIFWSRFLLEKWMEYNEIAIAAEFDLFVDGNMQQDCCGTWGPKRSCSEPFL